METCNCLLLAFPKFPNCGPRSPHLTSASSKHSTSEQGSQLEQLRHLQFLKDSEKRSAFLLRLYVLTLNE
ncbi:hypothetical protein J6590_052297 [Homalodisca vitripennis]|nr:hypothetical protein J6590_052297 [Homalodisca vitripennis]